MISEIILVSSIQTITGLLLFAYQCVMIPETWFRLDILMIVVDAVQILLQMGFLYLRKFIVWYNYVVAISQIIISLEIGIQTGQVIVGLEMRLLQLLLCGNLQQKSVRNNLTLLIASSLYTSLRLIQSSYEHNIFFSLIQIVEMALTFCIWILKCQKENASSLDPPPSTSQQEKQGFQKLRQPNDILHSERDLKKLSIKPLVVSISPGEENYGQDLTSKEFQQDFYKYALQFLQVGVALIQPKEFTTATSNPQINQQAEFQLQFSNDTIKKMFQVTSEQELYRELLELEYISFNDLQEAYEKKRASSKQLQNESLKLITQNQDKILEHRLSVSYGHNFASSQLKKDPQRQSFQQDRQAHSRNILNGFGQKVTFQQRLINFLIYVGEQKLIIPEQLGSFYIKSSLESIRRLEDINLRNPSITNIEITVLGLLFNKKPTLIIQTRDISHRNQIIKLIEMDQQKSNTLSFVSHEYRTPLDCIIRNLEESLLKKVDNTLQIKTSLENARYLLSLSNDLLDMAMIKAGRFCIKIERFDLKDLLEGVLEMFQLQAKRKGLVLSFQCESVDLNTIVSDPKRVRQILINLIGNAFKFTQDGYIMVKVQRCEAQIIKIMVEDTGLGIREEDQPRLMKAFEKCGDKENQKLNPQGVGLGLVISNQLASLISNNPQIGLQFSSTYKKG